MSTSSLKRVKFKGSLELVVAVFEEKLPLKKRKMLKKNVTNNYTNIFPKKKET